MDEIWTVEIVRAGMHSCFDALRIHSGNNHPLNTAILYLIGGSRTAWEVYRLPSLVAGLGTVGLAVRIGLRRTRVHAIVLGAATTLSFPLVVYSTEARGYAIASFFLLLAIDSMEQFFVARHGWASVVFWLSTILGALAQPAFMLAYPSLAVWSAWDLMGRASRWDVIKRLLWCHGVPVLFMTAFLVLYLRKVDIGVARETRLADLIRNTAAFAAGLGSGSVARWDMATIAALICGVSLVVVARADGRMAALLLVGIVAVPGLVLLAALATGERRFYPRHFIAGITFGVIAVGWAIGEMWSQRGMSRIWAVSVMSVFVAANLYQYIEFTMIGRSHQLQALKDIAASSSSKRITIGTSQRDRSLIILTFYAPYLPDDLELHFVEDNQLTSHPPDWYIGSSEQTEFTSLPNEFAIGDARYAHQRTYAYYGPSGIEWNTYRRADR
jgi:hypothetical protein